MPLIPNLDLPSSLETTSLQCRNLHQVFLCTEHSRCHRSVVHDIQISIA
jgi:hypothetical protein